MCCDFQVQRIIMSAMMIIYSIFVHTTWVCVVDDLTRLMYAFITQCVIFHLSVKDLYTFWGKGTYLYLTQQIYSHGDRICMYM